MQGRGTRGDDRRKASNNPNLHARQFGDIQPLSDFTQMTKDKTLSRKRTLTNLAAQQGAKSSAETSGPPTLPVGDPTGLKTSQRVIDAWAQKRRMAG